MLRIKDRKVQLGIGVGVATLAVLAVFALRKPAPEAVPSRPDSEALGQLEDLPEEITGLGADGLAIRPYPAYSGNELYVDGLRHLQKAAAASTVLTTDKDLALTIHWFVNGRAVGEGASLSPTFFEARDRITVKVEATDAEGNTDALGEASTRIRNAPPVLSDVTIHQSSSSPGQVYAFADVLDPDGDPVEIALQWSIDGQPVEGAHGDRFSLEGLTRGQSITVTVVAYDEKEKSPPRTSRPFKVDNFPPSFEVQSPQILTGLTGARTLRCPLALEDPDGDMVTVQLVGGPPGASWDAEAGAVVWAVPEGTDNVSFTVRATDERGGTFEQEVQLTL